jgi:hypothetical protein
MASGKVSLWRSSGAVKSVLGDGESFMARKSEDIWEISDYAEFIDNPGNRS